MIIGDGDDRGRLEEKVRSLGLSFAGKIPEQEKVSHYCLGEIRQDIAVRALCEKLRSPNKIARTGWRLGTKLFGGPR
jgi:hypothetical protein